MLDQPTRVEHHSATDADQQACLVHFFPIEVIMLMSLGDMVQEIDIDPIAFGTLSRTGFDSWGHDWILWAGKKGKNGR